MLNQGKEVVKHIHPMDDTQVLSMESSHKRVMLCPSMPNSKTVFRYAHSAKNTRFAGGHGDESKASYFSFGQLPVWGAAAILSRTHPWPESYCPDGAASKDYESVFRSILRVLL